MFQAKHNDDRIGEHICHNHDSAWIWEAAYKLKAKCLIIKICIWANKKSSVPRSKIYAKSLDA